MSSIIPKQICSAREALSLRDKEVAASLSIELQKLQEWERGFSEPPVDQLRRLAEFYGRSIDYFLSPTPPFPTKLSFRTPRKEE
jgi:transcriptional regulator with XRE-family HTH domain